jgi:hypothetical protein
MQCVGVAQTGAGCRSVVDDDVTSTWLAQSALQGISKHPSSGLSSLRTRTTSLIQHITTGE